MGGAASKSKVTNGTTSAPATTSNAPLPKPKDKKAKKKSQSSAPAGPTLPVPGGWASPYRFRELYHAGSGELWLSPEACESPSPAARQAGAAETREHINDLCFQIATNTQWKQQQVRGLLAVYKTCCLTTEDRLFNYRVFCLTFFPLSSHHHFPPRVIRKLYATVFDTDGDGLISFPDFVLGISKCIHGQRRHKMRLVFELFDTDNDGSWTLRDAADFLRTGMLYVKHLTLDSLEQVDMRDMLQEQQFEWWQQELNTMQQHMEADSLLDPTASPAASPSPSPSPIPYPSTPSARLISFNAFRSWSTRLFRFRPFLARFDVLPTAQQECATIRGLWNESSLKLGDTWYACSETWWRSWKTYSGFKEPGEEETAGASASATTTNNASTWPATLKKPLPEANSPSYLISDTDTDSDRDTGNGTARGGALATPGPSRTISHVASSPGAIHINGLSPEKSPAPSASPAAANGTTQPAAAASTLVTPDASRRNSVVHSANGIAVHLTPHQSAANAPAFTPTFANLSPSPQASSGSRAAAAALAALRPTAIDNSDLASSTNPLLLRDQLVEHEDFILLSEFVWRQLVEWYGFASAHTAFPRFVIEVGRDGARIRRIELYPLSLRIKRVAKDAPQPVASHGVPLEGTCLLFPTPGDCTVLQLEQRLSELFSGPETPNAKSKKPAPDAEPRSLRMWLREGNDYRCLLLNDMTRTLEELDLQVDDVVLVELEREGRSSTAAPIWYMDRRVIPKPWTQLQLGDMLDARDKQAVWYTSVVRGLTGVSRDANGNLINGEGTVTVRFVGWDEKWNEAIPVSSLCKCRGPCSCTGRLAALGAQVRFKKVDPATTAASPGPEAGHPSATAPALQRGLCGLQNIGNTCFLASTIQCLSNTPYFTANYFLARKHVAELNRTNKLGHKGLLAEEFAALIEDMWSGQYRAVAPSKFKRVLASFAPQFSGYQQHDSHELLAFLLDGLHEDLNRVVRPIPTAAVESNGRPDSVVVRESWAAYKVRNQSIVVDLFNGMLKSTVVCPEPACGKVSITFDPFRYLTVPLPQFTDRQFILTFCSLASTPLVNYGVILPEHATVGHIKEKLATMCGTPAHKLIICDVYKSKLHRVMMDSKRLTTIRDDDVLVAYEVVPDAFREVVATPSASGTSSTNNSSISSTSASANSSANSSFASSPSTFVLREDCVYLQAIHKYIMIDAHGNQNMSPRFGIPICVTTTPHMSNARVHNLVSQAIARWTPKMGPGRDAPYTVRVVDHTCARCGICPESSNCGGCCLPEDDRACGLDSGFALCILWETDLIARSVKASMDDTHIVDHPSVASKVRTDGALTLRDCLELFSTKETLSKEDAFFCSACKGFRQATKQLQVYHAPEILIVHLKRFRWINRIRREKQTVMVDFPIKGLDLAPFIPPHALENEAYPIYDLYAISNHSGSLSGGHYTSFALNPENSKWYHFDDSRVTEVPVSQIKTAFAYMLMYKRRG